MSMHWRALVLGLICGASGCSDDGLPAVEGSTSSTPTSGDSATGLSTSGGQMTTGPDESSGGEPGTTSDSGSSSGEPTTGPADTDTDTDTTAGSSGSSDDSGSSSGSTGNESSTGDTAGMSTDYAGTWEGMCAVIGMVSGTVEVHIFDDGTVTGSFAGDDMGTFDGTIDDEGMISTSGTGMLAGACTFDGQLEMDSLSGTWSCPTAMCTGTWEASPS